MEFYNLGIIIKELRKKNMSQSELCHGICSQSQISKIEKVLFIHLAYCCINYLKDLVLIQIIYSH